MLENKEKSWNTVWYSDGSANLPAEPYGFPTSSLIVGRVDLKRDWWRNGTRQHIYAFAGSLAVVDIDSFSEEGSGWRWFP